jgi:hypothetical protein
LSGSGDIQLSGTTVNLDTNLNGSGDIDAGNLKATNAKATVSGSGDTTIYCSDTFTLEFQAQEILITRETQQKKM